MKNTRPVFKNQQGFNLIELMIVIAIIALLIAVGIPGYQAMVRSGNETTTLKSMDTIRTCQFSFASKHQGKFAPSFDELAKSNCIDANKFNGENPVVNGYVYTMTSEEPTSKSASIFKLKVNPQVSTGIGATGSRYFYTDSTLSAVKSNEEQDASATDPSI